MATIATIGTFVVESGDQSTPDSRRLRTAANDMETAPASNGSSQQYPPSLLQSAAAASRQSTNENANANSPPPRRMLLQGPPKSGRSSVTMDLAYAIAAATPCRQHCEASSSSCRCVAVTLFLPCNNDNGAAQQDPQFPLHCQELTTTHARQDTNGTNSNDQRQQGQHSFQVQMQQLEQSKAAVSSQHATTAWKMDILRRIQVRHVASVREVWGYLLTVQGKPVGEQPWGGILMDSLDVLTGSNSATGSTDDHGTRMSQLLAILVDTVHSLERIHGDACRPLILVTTANTLSAKLQSFWSALVPEQMTLIPSSTKSVRSWQAVLGSEREQEAVVVSTWAVIRSHTKEVVADYAMVRGLDNCLRIVWTETARRAGDEVARA